MNSAPFISFGGGVMLTSCETSKPTKGKKFPAKVDEPKISYTSQ